MLDGPAFFKGIPPQSRFPVVLPIGCHLAELIVGLRAGTDRETTPPEAQREIDQLNRDFPDLVRTGAIVQTSALRQEKNEPEIWALPRLVMTPYRRSFGRFRQLIDAINEVGASGS